MFYKTNLNVYRDLSLCALIRSSPSMCFSLASLDFIIIIVYSVHIILFLLWTDYIYICVLYVMYVCRHIKMFPTYIYRIFLWAMLKLSIFRNFISFWKATRMFAPYFFSPPLSLSRIILYSYHALVLCPFISIECIS